MSVTSQNKGFTVKGKRSYYDQTMTRRVNAP